MDLTTVDELLTTTRSVRKRLDLERPVPLDEIEKCIEIALQAPTASNSQGWQILVVTDAQKKKAVADLYRDALSKYAQGQIASLVDAGLDPNQERAEGDARGVGMDRILGSAMYLAENLEKVPVWVIFCAERRVAVPDVAPWASLLGSVLPSAWSFMLAARARGIGSAWTSIHLVHEREAAKILEIPDDWTQTVLLPVAWYTGESFRRAPRRPVREVVHWNRAGNHERPAS